MQVEPWQEKKKRNERDESTGISLSPLVGVLLRQQRAMLLTESEAGSSVDERSTDMTKIAI